MIQRFERHSLIVLLLLAALLRLAVLVAFYPSLFAFEQTGAIHGSAAYDTYALNLLATGVYGKAAPGVPDAHLPPLYSVWVAGVYMLLGRSGFAVAFSHIALDLFAIVALYHLARRLFPTHGQGIGLLSGLMVAFYPYLIFQNLTLIDTPLYMALLFGWLWMMAALRDRPVFDRSALLLALVAGLLLGALALVRSNAVLLAPLVCLWFLFRRSFWQSVMRAAVVALVSALAVAPWLVHAYNLYGRFIPISINGGENWYQGNSIYTIPYFQAGYDVQWTPPPPELDDGVNAITPERSDALAAAGWAYLRAYPERIAELWWTKFLVHWSIDIAPRRNPADGGLPEVDERGAVVLRQGADGLSLEGLDTGDPVTAYSSTLFDVVGRGAHIIYFGGLLLLSLGGIIASRRLWRDVSLLWLLQIGTTITYVLFHPSTRYRVPTDPLLFLFAAFLIVFLWGRWRMRTSQA